MSRIRTDSPVNDIEKKAGAVVMQNKEVYSSVDPLRIPSYVLRDGSLMPAIGLGTFGSDSVGPDTVGQAAALALRMGYRFLDCAACYGNEAQIGQALREVLGTQVKREDVFLLSKVWNDCHAPEQVAASCEKSLRDLGQEVLDGYLVHWPFPNAHAPGCDGDVRNPHSRPYIHEEFMETWRAMEELKKRGLVRNIGVSNVTIPKLRLLLHDALEKPSFCEMELHPTFQQGELFQYCLDQGIQPVGYCPLGSPARPERDKAPGDLVDTQTPEVLRVAQSHSLHPAAVCLKWARQRGQIPIPFSVNPVHMLANLKAICEDPLTPEEMHILRGADRNCRLIKGQVFLWPGAKSWIDLWDVDGSIPSWKE